MKSQASLKFQISERDDVKMVTEESVENSSIQGNFLFLDFNGEKLNLGNLSCDHALIALRANPIEHQVQNLMKVSRSIFSLTSTQLRYH